MRSPCSSAGYVSDGCCSDYGNYDCDDSYHSTHHSTYQYGWGGINRELTESERIADSIHRNRMRAIRRAQQLDEMQVPEPPSPSPPPRAVSPPPMPSRAPRNSGWSDSSGDEPYGASMLDYSPQQENAPQYYPQSAPLPPPASPPPRAASPTSLPAQSPGGWSDISENRAPWPPAMASSLQQENASQYYPSLPQQPQYYPQPALPSWYAQPVPPTLDPVSAPIAYVAPLAADVENQRVAASPFSHIVPTVIAAAACSAFTVICGGAFFIWKRMTSPY